jgi:hypothetical protein
VYERAMVIQKGVLRRVPSRKIKAQERDEENTKTEKDESIWR